MTYDEVVKIALSFPETTEGTSYGTPGVKRKKRFMFRLKEDGESIAVKLDWETRDRFLSQRPEIFYLTPHYERYPALLARLETMTIEQAKELLQACWEDAPYPAKPGP